MVRFLLSLVALVLMGVAPASAVPCYKWTNEAPQTVVLNFVALDSALSPTGQRRVHILTSGSNYEECAGYNTYYNVVLRNGRYNGWDAETIFGEGYRDSSEFVIAANLSTTSSVQNKQAGTVAKIASVGIVLDTKYLPTGNVYNIQVSDLICPGNVANMSIVGGTPSMFTACTNAADFARVAIKNLTTNSQVTQCGQVHGGDSCIVP